MSSNLTLSAIPWAKRRHLPKACQFCAKDFTTKGLPRHEAACGENPERANEKTRCEVCHKLFFDVGRNGAKAKRTCSYACSNTLFRSGLLNANVNKNSYKVICFAFHERKCLICGEDKILHVHHVDGDRTNNSPENLVPLCPTHHQYVHSRYSYLVLPSLEEYLKEFKDSQANGPIKFIRHRD